MFDKPAFSSKTDSLFGDKAPPSFNTKAAEAALFGD